MNDGHSSPAIFAAVRPGNLVIARRIESVLPSVTITIIVNVITHIVPLIANKIINVHDMITATVSRENRFPPPRLGYSLPGLVHDAHTIPIPAGFIIQISRETLVFVLDVASVVRILFG